MGASKVSDVPPELIERMVALCREIAQHGRMRHRAVVEAEAIVALLPPPADPDLAEARVAMEEWRLETDDESQVQIIAWAIKRGRKLATQVSA